MGVAEASPPPSVRRATPDDLPVLRRIQQSLDEPAPGLLDAAVSGLLGTCFVAVADGPVGYLLAVDGAGWAGELPAAEDPPDEAPATHVAELAVAPAARREGHASALLATLLSAQPTATVTLTVAADNDAALALYEAFGFETVRALPDFFEEGRGLLLARRP